MCIRDRRSSIGKRAIGRVRLGLTRTRLLRSPRLARVRPPSKKSGRYRYCVKRSRGRVTAVFGRRGRVELVTTTARGHGNRRVRPGRSARSLRAYPRRRRLARGLFRASPRGARVIGVRKGKVRFVGVASKRVLRKPNRPVLRRYLRRAGL